MGKAGFHAVREPVIGKDSRATDERSSPGMRVLFFTWIVLIASGLVFYSIVGLSHH
jgi:hypothetical protein